MKFGELPNQKLQNVKRWIHRQFSVNYLNFFLGGIGLLAKCAVVNPQLFTNEGLQVDHRTPDYILMQAKLIFGIA